MTKPYRIKVQLNGCLTKTLYIVRDTNGDISCFDKNETPHGLSYIADNAAELRFVLKDASSKADALAAIVQAGHNTNQYSFL